MTKDDPHENSCEWEWIKQNKALRLSDHHQNNYNNNKPAKLMQTRKLCVSTSEDLNVSKVYVAGKFIFKSFIVSKTEGDVKICEVYKIA